MTDTSDTLIVVPPAGLVVNDNRVTINTIVNPPPAVPVRPAPKAAPKTRAPVAEQLPAKPAIAAPELPAPAYNYDANGMVLHTTYTDKTGGKIVIKPDPSDHNRVTLELSDGKTKLVTYGDRRGFEATVDGKAEKANNWHFPLPDTLTCPGGFKLINTNETESVTREKLQQFAKDHPQLATVMRTIELPVTVMGGYPVTFAKAVDTPSEFRACNQDIVLERLTEKSAGR